MHFIRLERTDLCFVTWYVYAGFIVYIWFAITALALRCRGVWFMAFFVWWGGIRCAERFKNDSMKTKPKWVAFFGYFNVHRLQARWYVHETCINTLIYLFSRCKSATLSCAEINYRESSAKTQWLTFTVFWMHIYGTNNNLFHNIIVCYIYMSYSEDPCHIE